MAASLATRADTIGRYEVVSSLAKGGMAQILLARATGPEGFERLVVLKQILPQLAMEREFVAMFLDEARIAATLHHPNIVQVYDVLHAEGSYAIAMEYLQGADLATLFKSARTRRTPIPLEIVVHIITEVCAGLHYAHERTTANGEPLDIMHRDISPQNIIVTYEGAVKLVDFGIAKAAQRLTATSHSSLKGKPPYMSPEQSRSRPLDRRTDVFSLAIVLWELLTLRRLYAGQSDYDVLKQIVEEDAPSPCSVVPDLPGELERIVMRGLARDPDARYASALELQLDLERFARSFNMTASTRQLGAFVRSTIGESTLEHSVAGRRLESGVTTATTRPIAPRKTETVDGHTEVLSYPTGRQPMVPRRSRLFVAIAVVLAAAGIAAGGAYLSSRSGAVAANARSPNASNLAPPLDSTANAAAFSGVAPAPPSNVVPPLAAKAREPAGTEVAPPDAGSPHPEKRPSRRPAGHVDRPASHRRREMPQPQPAAPPAAEPAVPGSLVPDRVEPRSPPTTRPSNAELDRLFPSHK